MNKNEIFFAEVGLTSTSANHIANLAKEYVQNIQAEINNLALYSEEVSLISADSYKKLSEGVDSVTLASIPAKLEKISNAKSLIAWLREAIKAKAAMLDNVSKMALDDTAEWRDKVPVAPTKRVVTTEDDVIAEMDIKQRNRYYSLETEAAVLGKFIHPDGNFAEARQKFLNKLHHTHEVKGEGRDTLLYRYSPSVSEEEVENIYFQLQKRHREVQAQLNGMKHDIEEKVTAAKIQALAEYNEKYAIYSAEYAAVVSQFAEYKEREAERIAALKIVVPNDLKEICETINSLGK